MVIYKVLSDLRVYDLIFDNEIESFYLYCFIYYDVGRC